MQTAIGMALALNSVTWVLCAFWVFFVRKSPIYHPVSFIIGYHLIGFVVRPAFIFFQNGSDVWLRTGVYPSDEIIFYTAIVSSFGLLALLFGVFFSGKKNTVIEKIQPANIEVRNPKRYYATVLIFCALGIWGLITGYGGAGLDTVQAFEVEYDAAGGQKLVGVSGYVLALGEFLPVICIMLFMDRKRRTLAIGLITIYVAVRFYIGAQRLSFVVVLIGAYLFTLINARRRYPPMRIFVVVLLFALIFDVIGGDRYAFRRLTMGEESLSGLIENYLSARSKTPLVNDLAEFDVASSALAVIPEKTGWSYGSQYLRLIIWPIPRQFWADKPVYTSLVDLNQHGYFLAMTHTLYIDAYMVLGFLPMMAILFGFGYYIGRLYERAKRTTSILWFMTFWVQLMYMKTLLRDGGVTVFYFLLLSLFCIFILKYAGNLKLVRDEI